MLSADICNGGGGGCANDCEEATSIAATASDITLTQYSKHRPTTLLHGASITEPRREERSSLPWPHRRRTTNRPGARGPESRRARVGSRSERREARPRTSRA